MKKLFVRLVRDQLGVTAMEYGLIAGLVAVVIIGAVTTVGTELIAVLPPLALLSLALPAVKPRIGGGFSAGEALGAFLLVGTSATAFSRVARFGQPRGAEETGLAEQARAGFELE